MNCGLVDIFQIDRFSQNSGYELGHNFYDQKSSTSFSNWIHFFEKVPEKVEYMRLRGMVDTEIYIKQFVFSRLNPINRSKAYSRKRYQGKHV